MKRTFGIVGIVICLIVAWRVLGNSGRASPAAPTPGAGGASAIPVEADLVTQRDMRQRLEVSGTLQTDQDVRIGSRISGKVARVLVKVGDRVQPNQLLVELSDIEVGIQLQRARAQLAENRARLRYIRHLARVKDATARSEVERARQALQAAQSRLEQTRRQARIVAGETETRVRTAAANLEAARHRLKILKDGARQQELREAELAVRRAEVEWINARRVYERREQLFRDDAISRETLDEAERTLRVAEAALAAARERLSLVAEGPRTEEIRVAEEQVRIAEEALRQAETERDRRQISEDDIRAAAAEVERARAALQAAEAGLAQIDVSQAEIAQAEAAVAESEADVAFAEKQVRDTRILSPVAGVVTRRMVNPGEIISPQDDLLQIVALDALYLEAQVPELDLAMVRPGMRARVAVDALGSRRFEGTVREIIPVAEPNSALYRVRIQVRRDGVELPAGGFARAVIEVGTRPNAIVVPRDTVRAETGERYVYLIAEEGGTTRARRQKVEIGLADDEYLEVLAGVRPGQRIVGVGSPAIQDGTPIRVVATAGARAGAAPSPAR